MYSPTCPFAPCVQEVRSTALVVLAAQAVDKYKYQEYETSTFSCLGFEEDESYSFFERRADGRRERVPVTAKTAANLAGYLSSYFGKLKKKPTVLPKLHFLPPRVRRCGDGGGVCVCGDSLWWVVALPPQHHPFTTSPFEHAHRQRCVSPPPRRCLRSLRSLRSLRVNL